MDNHANNVTMTPEQVAQRWGVSANTVRDMLCGGTLKGFKLTPGAAKSQWRVLVTEVERFERGGK